MEFLRKYYIQPGTQKVKFFSFHRWFNFLCLNIKKDNIKCGKLRETTSFFSDLTDKFAEGFGFDGMRIPAAAMHVLPDATGMKDCELKHYVILSQEIGN